MLRVIGSSIGSREMGKMKTDDTSTESSSSTMAFRSGFSNNHCSSFLIIGLKDEDREEELGLGLGLGLGFRSGSGLGIR